MTCQEAAKRLGIALSTVKKYLDAFFPNDSLRDMRGRRLLTTEQFQTLVDVDKYSKQKYTLAEIRRILRGEDPTGATSDTDVLRDEDAPASHRHGTSDADVREMVRTEIAGALRENSEMALALSQATYKVGQLEERVSTLSQQLQEARQLLTEGSGEREAAKQEAISLAAQLQEVRQQLAGEAGAKEAAKGEAAELRQKLSEAEQRARELEARANRSIWQRLLGRAG